MARNDTAAPVQVPRPRAEVFWIREVCRGLRSHIVVPKRRQEPVVQDVDGEECGIIVAENHARQAQDKREHGDGHGGIGKAGFRGS